MIEKTRFSDLAIRNKLLLIIGIITSAALLLATGVQLLYERHAFKQHMAEEISVLAKVIADRSSAAILFNDHKIARENLAALSLHADIEEARLYLPDGSLFAQYSRGNEAYAACLEEKLHTGFEFRRKALEVAQEVRVEDKYIGTLRVCANLESLTTTTLNHVRVAAFALLVVVVLVLVSAKCMQGLISQPIARLAAIARQVTETRDYDMWTERHGKDEIGQLMDSFNAMLATIRAGNEELDRHHHHLEELVEKRTRQLAEERERAEAASHAKSTFLANMSHELRTPLNAILGFSQLMARESGITPVQQNRLNTINRAGEHLLGMINDVLDISKIEAGKIETKPEVFHLIRMLRDIAEMFRLRAEQKGLDFDLALEDCPFSYVRLDQGKLRQVLINLLGNAVKFTRQGKITLHADCLCCTPPECHGDTLLHLEVEDTGIGIAGEELRTIFEPFAQATSSEHPEHKGTGLGLSISRSYVELMGGTLEVDSRLGQGTCFHLNIPVQTAEKPGGKTDEQIKVSGLAADQSDWRILVVDDDSDNRTLFTSLLEPVGFSVREACDGEEAVAVFQTWSPHFIWLDMRMPVMDGYVAAHRIRTLPDGEAVKIVAVTAEVFHEQVQEIFDAGCDDIVFKPYTAFEIFTVLKKHLAVRYIYADSPRSASREAQAPLRAEDLKRLPRDLLDALLKALLELNAEEVEAVTAEIRRHEPEIADALTALSKQYRYEHLIELCRRAKEP